LGATKNSSGTGMSTNHYRTYPVRL